MPYVETKQRKKGEIVSLYVIGFEPFNPVIDSYNLLYGQCLDKSHYQNINSIFFIACLWPFRHCWKAVPCIYLLIQHELEFESFTITFHQA